MTSPFDVAVVGLGAMGSAAAYHLARRGARVLGVDRHSPPHGLGSSHGQTRMIREAYYEHPLYVPLVQRAYALWGELERDAGDKTLFIRTGGLMVGHPESGLVRGTIRSATTHELGHEIVPARPLHRRFPAFAPLDEMVGVFEPRAGVLLPERIIETHLQLAEHHGAELRREVAVMGWERTPEGIALRVGDETLVAKQMVVATGAWTRPFFSDLELPLQVERQVIYWFDPVRFEEYFTPERMPVSLWELEGGGAFYTVPDFGDGVKVGVHHGGVITTADAIDRRVHHDEDAQIYDLLRRFVPFAKGHMRNRAVCMYTNTPDAHFVIDRHPGVEEIVILSPCSGHGFKFSSVLGEVTADLVMRGGSSFDLSPFSLRRFAAPT